MRDTKKIRRRLVDTFMADGLRRGAGISKRSAFEPHPMPPCHVALYKGKLVHIEEDGDIPGGRARFGDGVDTQGFVPGFHFKIPILTRFQTPGPPFRGWYGGWISEQDSNITAIHLRTWGRAKKWLQRAGQGKVWNG